MVPSAELRVFQPLAAFPAEEQAHWERYILGGGMIRPPRPVYRQRTTSRRLGFLVPAAGEGAHVKLVEGQYYLCPLRTRMRVLAGLLAFREAAPFEGSEAFIPREEAKRASKELGRLRRRNPGHIACVMQSTWHVPVRWFVLFDDDERRIVERDGRRALLLPEVATDHGWDDEQMLKTACEKAGLRSDAWQDPRTTRHVFRTVRFGGPASCGN